MSAVGETGLPYRMSNATAFARDRVMSTRTIFVRSLAGRAHRTAAPTAPAPMILLSPPFLRAACQPPSLAGCPARSHDRDLRRASVPNRSGRPERAAHARSCGDTHWSGQADGRLSSLLHLQAGGGGRTLSANCARAVVPT